MPRIVASFFSGAEANHIAIDRAAVPWRTDTVSEIEPFPCAVLAERCPDAVNLGDFTKLNPADMYAAEIAVGGPPCQSFSIAGGRKGLDDERGNLTLQYVDLCHDLNTNGHLRVAFYENVPGILSDKTNAFGCLISALVGGVVPLRKPRDASWPSFGMASGPRARLAWRTLDAQWFGLAQRRRRVFIVVCFDKRLDPAKILFERKSLQGNTPPSRSAGKGFARDVGNSAEIRDWGGVAKVAPCLKANGSPRGDQKGMEDSLIPEVRLINGDGAITGALAAETGAKQQSYIAEPKAFDMRGREGGAQMEGPHDTANIRAASGGSSKSYIASQYAVRRLMPVETERLQGFPDGWTKIPYRNKTADQCPDGHRYKAMGNSWAVNVIAWIYTRIEAEMSAIDNQNSGILPNNQSHERARL